MTPKAFAYNAIDARERLRFAREALLPWASSLGLIYDNLDTYEAGQFPDRFQR